MSEVENEEFYSLLNVKTDASQEEIRTAYLGLCRIYHPDRYLDKGKQLVADQFFKQIQEAYQILSDPKLRAIYDIRGKKGVMDDKAIIERTALPRELMKEYEKLSLLFEERTYIQKANPTGLFEMKIDAARFFSSEDVGRNLIYIDEVRVQQQVDARITNSCMATFGGMVYANSTSFLSFAQVHFKQQLDKKNWMKVGTAVGFPSTVGVDFFRYLTHRLCITSYNFIQIHSGCLVVSVNGQLSCKLDDRSTIVYKAENNASSLGVEINRVVSEKLSVKGEIIMANDSSHVGLSCLYQPKKDYLFNCTLKLCSAGPFVSYGFENKLAALTNLGAVVSVSPSGVCLHVTFTRTTMSFFFKFVISHSPTIYAIAVSTITPMVAFCFLKMLKYAFSLKNCAVYELNEIKEEQEREMLKRKKEAGLVVDLMRKTAERISFLEEARRGLVIIEALYGCLFSNHRIDPLAPPKIIDVTIPLQAAVQDSKLILRSSSKSLIPGFYDPCIGESKHLRVRYEFRGHMHEVTIENAEPLIIPRHSHKLVKL